MSSWCGTCIDNDMQIDPFCNDWCGTCSKIRMQKNKSNGKLAQLYSQQDFINNGFSIWFVGDRGFDFIAYKGEKVTTMKNSDTLRIKLLNCSLFYLVEVKYGKSRLSRLQKLVQRRCRKSHVNYFVYRVTQEQLEFWLIKQRQNMVLGQ